jgi:hypothetical protein
MALSTKSLMLTHKTGMDADVLLAQTELKVIKGGMYHALDNGKLRYGLNANTYFEFASIQDVNNATFTFNANDTDSLDLTFAGNSLTGLVKLNAAVDNAIGSTPTGLYAKRMTVDPTSTGFLSIDVNNRIKLEKQATVEVIVNATDLTLASFVANSLGALDVDSGDYIYLQNATNPKERGWIVAINNPTTVAHFVPVEFPDYSDVQIRALFSSGQGIVYNPSNGVISAKISADASNDLSFGTDNGLFLNAAVSAVDIVDGATNTTISIEAALNNLYLRSRVNARNGVTMITEGAGATAEKVFKLGGNLTESTTIGGNNQQFYLTGAASIELSSSSTIQMVASSFLDMSVTGGGTMHLDNTELEINRDIHINGGNLIISNSNNGIRFKAPDGTFWLGKLNNDGQLEFEPNA